MRMKRKISNNGLQRRYPATSSSSVFFGRATVNVFLLVILLLLPVTGCTNDAVNDIESEENDLHSANGEEDSAVKEQRETSDLGRPPIDREIPDHLETATLGMG